MLHISGVLYHLTVHGNHKVIVGFYHLQSQNTLSLSSTIKKLVLKHDMLLLTIKQLISVNIQTVLREHSKKHL